MKLLAWGSLNKSAYGAVVKWRKITKEVRPGQPSFFLEVASLPFMHERGREG